ncbi:metallophosphoesterase family protein [Pokkaliibacter sp. CJK22405]|uniref:metallophosphoesterase family protein n=1 Tax=Pokkaliibacter sp. CJK22405 TaxID=3384615 RepID=UPI0039846ED2
MQIAHISDPHFGTEQLPQLQAMEKSLRQSAPDLVVISGDLTQRARKDQYQAARAFFDRLGLPILVVPGNHDIPLYNVFARLLHPYRGYQRHFGGQLDTRFVKDNVEIIGLTSAQWWRHKDGEVDIKALRQKLSEENPANQEAESQPRLRLAVFHHPLDCKRKQDEVNIIRNADEVLHTMIDCKIDAVLGGHIHDPLMRTSAHRYPRQPAPMLFVLAGTCISHRVRIGAPNSFNYLRLRPEKSQIETVRMDWNKDAKSFFEKEVRHFERGGTGWFESAQAVHVRDIHETPKHPVSDLII